MSLLRIIVLLQFGLKADEMAECDIIAEAMKLAVNDIKAATLLLKEGNVSKSRQREVIASWAKTSEKPKTGPKNKPKSTRQENITRVMKDRGLSHAAALDYVNSGGLEAEELQKEMAAENPMHKALDQAIARGPPQWFLDGLANIEKTGEEEEEGGNAA